MCAAGIERQIAANRTDLLTRRIGRVIEPMGSGGLRDRQVDRTGLHNRQSLQRIELEDLVHPIERDDDPFGMRNRAARQTCATTTRDKRNLPSIAGLDHLLNFGFGFRHDHRQRSDRESGQPVTLVRHQPAGMTDQSRLGKPRCKFLQQTLDRHTASSCPW